MAARGRRSRSASGSRVALRKAIRRGDPEAVRTALAQGPSLAAEADGSTSLLELAAERGNVEIVEALLAAGHAVDPPTEASPLAAAAFEGHTEVVRRLLDVGAAIDREDEDRTTALHAAAIGGHPAAVRLLIERGARIDSGVIVGAGDEGHAEVVELLAAHVPDDEAREARERLARRPARVAPVSKQRQRWWREAAAAIEARDVGRLGELVRTPKDADGTNEQGGTLMDVALGLLYPECLQLLLDRGADLERRDREGRTPLLIYAPLRPYVDRVRWLVEHGADVHARDDEGSTPLIRAARESPEAVRLLLQAGAEIDARNRDGISALMQAVHFSTHDRGAREAAGILREAGASEEGVEPPALLAAVRRGDEAEARRLLEAGADPNETDAWKRAPLHDAIQLRNAALVRFLLERGANPNLSVGRGALPLDSVLRWGDEPTLRVLVDHGAKLYQRYDGLRVRRGRARGGVDRLLLLESLGVEVWARGRKPRA